MAKYELAVVVADEDDLPSGHKRKKAGYILAIKPYPWDWGAKEIKNHIIVIFESIEPYEKLQRFLLRPLYEDGKEVDEFSYPVPAPIAKRRIFLMLSKIKELKDDVDLIKTADKNYIYQPFKKVSQLIQKFDGQNGNRYLTSGDVDCGVDPEIEYSILEADDIFEDYDGKKIKKDEITNWVIPVAPSES